LWPHDPRVALRALRQRNNFDSLVSAYVTSYCVAKNDPARYARMGEQAREAMRRHASAAVVAERLQAFLKTPPRPPRYGESFGRIKEMCHPRERGDPAYRGSGFPLPRE